MSDKTSDKNQDHICESNQLEQIVSPRKLKQEYYDSGSQIIYVELFDKLSGKWFSRFELHKYPYDTNNFAIIDLLIDNKVSPNIIYKAIKLLGKQIAVSLNHMELLRKAG